jgi:hypothetical protein
LAIAQLKKYSHCSNSQKETEPLYKSTAVLAVPQFNEAESSKHAPTQHSNPQRSGTIIGTLRYNNKKQCENAHTWQQQSNA